MAPTGMNRRKVLGRLHFGLLWDAKVALPNKANTKAEVTTNRDATS